ncbi:LysR family transcriptional regulator [Tolumonas lignilytica]|uniref:LysR family transcriptional regulator n=1 Tax=Tolumonas lignilytica TaxID=1283284 RepID=UPI000465BD6A|nr:LysR family transcriptional regulator [Tolumonas lignilytica]
MKSNYSLDDLRYFCIVAKMGSFKDASDHLQIPLSTLSRRIQRLEADLKLRLLNRDSHKVVLTHVGQKYFIKANSLFDELTTLGQELQNDKNKLTGKIRISAPIHSGTHLLSQVFFDFMSQYTEINLDIHFSNKLIDLEKDAIDVAFRVASPAIDHWIARPIKNFNFILCAHSSYDTSSILHPSDLDNHPLIVNYPVFPWELISKETNEEFTYKPDASIKMEVDELVFSYKSICTGVGIGFLPDYLAIPKIQSGLLKRVLPFWHGKNKTIYMIYRERDNLPYRVRVFIDHILRSQI